MRRFSLGILRFHHDSENSILGIAIPNRFRAIPSDSAPVSDSEAGIDSTLSIPCNVGTEYQSGSILGQFMLSLYCWFCCHYICIFNRRDLNMWKNLLKETLQMLISSHSCSQYRI
ncbi:hypothetical protein ISN44_As11g031840 [Arabidopsis suecica]|uniref:Uncharacterized protein n=1 Tax=Arabidopsis suecica TaxID=45249 RepID=A0A8T1ZGA6_ARASU|nr:hypothetical protein ISN44_As11g031840 [Arabidopsis suecica]